MAKANKKTEQKQDDKTEKPSVSLEQDLAAALLLKEADEDLRQEKLKNIWDEWGSTIIGVALMLVFGTMIGVGWQNWRYSVNSQQTEILLSPGMNQNAELSGDYAGIAALIQAGQLSEGGADFASMINQQLSIAADAGLPREWDILAQWGAYRTKADALGTGNEDDLITIANDMVSLADKRNHPYKPLILMEAAIIYAENGLVPEAIDTLARAKTNEMTLNNAMLMQQINHLMSFYQNIGEI